MIILLNDRQRKLYDDAMQDVNKYLDAMNEKLSPVMKERIPIEKVFTSKARSRHACVNRTDHSLNISEHMFTEATHEELVNTLLHEMCHMFKKAGHGHGEMWRYYAAIASAVSGLEITRCNNIGSYSEERAERRRELIKKSGLRFRCLDCGTIIERTRRSNFTEHYDRYTCGRCGGHFEKITK